MRGLCGLFGHKLRLHSRYDSPLTEADTRGANYGARLLNLRQCKRKRCGYICVDLWGCNPGGFFDVTPEIPKTMGYKKVWS